MKKFLLLSLLLAGTMSVSAQGIELLFGEQPVQEGTVYQTGYTVRDYGAFQVYVQDSNLFIRGAKGENCQVEVRADNPCQLCLFGGCAMLEEQADGSWFVSRSGQLGTTISANPGTEITESALLDKSTTVMGGNAFTGAPITVEFKIWATSAPNDVKTAKVQMLNVPESEVGKVNAAIASNEGLRMKSARTLAYNFAQPTVVTLYSTTGSVVKKATVRGQGTISLANLSNGIYFYRAGDHTGKILVK